MVAYDETLRFLKNIYYAKGRPFDETYSAMWIREITATGASAIDLHNAEMEIIREDIPLRVFDICEIIRQKMNLNTKQLGYQKKPCKYCDGKGYVIGLKFETNGKYTGYTAALNCCCDNKHLANVVPMKEDINNHHRTEVKGGYYLIFPTIVEQFDYLDKVYANDNWDLRRK